MAPNPIFTDLSKKLSPARHLCGAVLRSPQRPRRRACDKAIQLCDERASGLTGSPRLRARAGEQRLMQFLKTLSWVLIAVIVVLFGTRNWTDVTLSLWGDIQADIKIPILLLIVFLIGFLPTWLIMRARIWSGRRRLEAMARQYSAPAPVPAPEESSAA
jgi:uncharacterized integral membrane protein